MGEHGIERVSIDDYLLENGSLAEFNCNNDGLNEYLRNPLKALNHHKKKFTNTTLLIDKEINKPIAYITTRFNTLILDEKKINDLLDEVIDLKNLPDIIPCIEVINLATNYNQQERGYGSTLIKDILDIALEISQDIGCRYVFLWSIRDWETTSFYKKLGFKEMPKSSANESFLLMRFDLLAFQRTMELNLKMNRIV